MPTQPRITQQLTQANDGWAEKTRFLGRIFLSLFPELISFHGIMTTKCRTSTFQTISYNFFRAQEVYSTYYIGYFEGFAFLIFMSWNSRAHSSCHRVDTKEVSFSCCMCEGGNMSFNTYPVIAWFHARWYTSCNFQTPSSTAGEMWVNIIRSRISLLPSFCLYAF